MGKTRSQNMVWAKPGLRTSFGQSQAQLWQPLLLTLCTERLPPGELSCSLQHLWVSSVILREKWQKKNPTVLAEHFVGGSSEPGVSLSVPAPVHSRGGCPNISLLG